MGMRGLLILVIGGASCLAALSALAWGRPAAMLGIAAGISAVVIGSIAYQRVGAGPVHLVGIGALLLPLNGVRVAGTVSIGDLALVGITVACIPLIRRAAAPPQLFIVLIGMLLVTAGGIVGMIATADWSSTTGLAKFVFGAPLIVLLVMILRPGPRDATILLAWYSLGAVVSCYDAMTEPPNPYFGRGFGMGAGPGHLALAGLLGTFVWLGLTIVAKRWSVRLVTLVLAGTCIYGVLLSGTRSALIGLIVGLAFIALSARIRGLTWAVAGGASVAAILYAALPYLPASVNVERALGQGPLVSSGLTNLEHAKLVEESLRRIAEHPWTGSGFSHGQFAHNLELQTVQIGGLIALVGFLVIWFPIFLMVTQSLTHGLNRDVAIRVCTAGAIVAYFVFAQFQPLIWDRHLWFFLALALTLQVPMDRPAQPAMNRPAEVRAA